MNYEKKYKEAQKWVESIYPELSHEQQMEAEGFFPELAGKDTENESGWVDLGLPSGTLWATCNVGANAPEEYGDYFTHDEAKKLDCTIPTEEHFVELCLNCTCECTTKNGVNGCLFTGINEKTLFLPDTSYHNNDSLLCDVGSRGNYLARTLGGYVAISMFYLFFNARGVYYDHSYVKDYGLSVRAVKRKEE